MIYYLMIIGGFVLLIKGADFLLDGATSIARRASVSDLVIGLTVVAFGTSMPEFFVNIAASIRGSTDIAIGNVLGSNIANILLILGVSAMIFPISVKTGTVWKEIPFSLLASIILLLMANDQIIDKSQHSILTRIDGLVLLCFFVIFIYYSFSIACEINGMATYVPSKRLGVIKSVFLVVCGLSGLSIGGKLIVDGSVNLALRMGMDESVVGLTIVALGTSLPELATSAVAAYRKNVEIAVGNVIGSNIFNIFFVLGTSSAIKPLPFKVENNVDIGMVVVAGLLLFGCMFTGKKRTIDRWQGAAFLILYTLYIVYLLTRI